MHALLYAHSANEPQHQALSVGNETRQLNVRRKCQRLNSRPWCVLPPCRCAKFRFRPLHQEIMSSRISHIAEAEALTLDADALPTLSAVSGGDLRKAITTLQSAVRLSAGGPVTRSALLDVSGQIPPDVVKALIAAAKKPGFAAVQTSVSNIIAEGYAAQQLLLQLQGELLTDSSIPQLKLAAIAETLAAADKCLVDGADEMLQLLNVAGQMQKILTS